jgi:hypothetical protein
VPQEPAISLRLPQGKSVDVFIVRLADGREVARTREEIEQLPPDSGAQVLGPAQPEVKP